MTTEKSLEQKVQEAIRNPQNMGEMKNADAIGTAGSADCGDMVRMWVKFKEQDGRKVIDQASFQSFGCETAIAVASLATELIKGKTAEEALTMSGQDLAADLGPLPPMKIHCTQLVEGALRSALTQSPAPRTSTPSSSSGNLVESLSQPASPGGVKVVLLKDTADSQKQ